MLKNQLEKFASALKEIESLRKQKRGVTVDKKEIGRILNTLNNGKSGR
jgi:hypothetical protein